MTNKEGATFVGQLYDVRTKRDGGGRISIDFGADGLSDIQWVQRVNAAKGCNFQIALVPMPHGSVDFQPMPDANGEIPL
jgi:hypothetical protein